MIVMNDDGMKHMLASKFKIGADASAAAGPVGRHAGADTDWKMKSEVLTYSRSRGLFAGIDLNGAAVTQDKDEDSHSLRQIRALRRHSRRQGSQHSPEPPLPDHARQLHGHNDINEQAFRRSITERRRHNTWQRIFYGSDG